MRKPHLFVQIVGFLCSLGCIVTAGVGNHSPQTRSRWTLYEGRSHRPPVNKSIGGTSFFSKSIFIGNYAASVYRNCLSSDDSTRGKRFLESDDTRLFYSGWYERYGPFFIRDICERSNRRILIYVNSTRLADFVSGRLAEILNFYVSYRMRIHSEIEKNLRDSYVSSQLSNCGVFHLSDDSFSLLPRRGHLILLVLGNVGLPINNLELSNQEPYLKSAYNNQQGIKNPQSPINPISFSGNYRHGGKFGDSYGMFCIIAALLICIPLGGAGLVLIDGRRRRTGWCVFIFSLLLNFAACTSGIIGCLPWDWHRCLHDGQDHSQNQDFHIQAAFCQNTGSMPSSCVS